MEPRRSLSIGICSATRTSRRPAARARSQRLDRATPALHELDCEPRESNGSTPTTPTPASSSGSARAATGRALRRGRQFHAGGTARLSHRHAGSLDTTAKPQLRCCMLWRQRRRERWRRQALWRAIVRSCTLSLPPLAAIYLAPATDDVVGSPPGSPSARRHLGRRGTNFALVLGARREGRAVPVRSRRPARDSSASLCPRTPTTSGTAICRSGSGPALRLSRPRPLRAGGGHRFNPTSCCSIPRQATRRPVCLERRAFRLSRRQRAAISPSTGATMRA